MNATGEGPQRIVAIRLADGAERPVGTTPRAPFVETFDDGIRDASLWHGSSTAGPRSASRGRLVMEIPGSATPGGQWNQVEAHWGCNAWPTATSMPRSASSCSE